MANKKGSTSPSSIERIPPKALEMEASVLGAILLDRDAYSDVAQLLVPDSFYEKRHALIFSAAGNLESEKKPIDINSVAEELRRLDELETVGGRSYLAELTQKVAGTANLDYNAHIVANKYISRRLINVGAEIVNKAYEDVQEVDQQMETAEQELFNLAQQNLQKGFVQAVNIVPNVLKEIDETQARGDGLSGLPSGFTSLDDKTAGWQKSNLVIVAARPAMGKTAFVLSMAKKMAIDNEIPIAVFNLEMSSEELMKRILSNLHDIEAEKLKTGKLNDKEISKLNQSESLLNGKPLYIDDTSSLSVFELRSKARRLVQEKGVKLIIIDYLQLMTARGMHFGNREQEVSLISRSLKILAKELNIPIIALSQLNRNLESRQGDQNSKQPQLSDLRESGAIEQDADMVCFIHRPEVYGIDKNEDETTTKGIGFIIIAKHRNGEIGKVKLAFQGKYVRFEDYDQMLFNNSIEESSLGTASDPFE